MKITIKNFKTDKTILSGDYESIKDALQQNRGANLRRADLREANLRGADLRGADLRGADLRGADLREANLWGADLRGADLREANLRGADLWEADLREANLWGADLDSIYIHIKGSDYDIYCINNQVQIGCEIHSFKWWGTNANKIEKENNRTKEQSKEYRNYIKICKSLNETKKGK
jgi:hypothetical protein